MAFEFSCSWIFKIESSHVYAGTFCAFLFSVTSDTPGFKCARFLVIHITSADVYFFLSLSLHPCGPTLALSLPFSLNFSLCP